MAIKSRENLVGAWAFLIGIVFAIVTGVITGWFETGRINPLILGVLAGLGLIIGYFVAEKDVQTFLLASVSLVIVSYSGISGLVLGAALTGVSIGKVISSMLQTLLALFVPATIVVALKTVFSIAKS